MRLKQLRLAQGYSVPQFSKLTNIPVRTIEDIEKRGDCKLSYAKIFAESLGVSIDELAKEEEPAEK